MHKKNTKKTRLKVASDKWLEAVSMRKREGKGTPFHIYQHLYIYRGQANNTLSPWEIHFGKRRGFILILVSFLIKVSSFPGFQIGCTFTHMRGASAAVTSLSSLDWKPLLQLQLRLKRKLKRKIRRKLKKSNENVTALYGLKPLLAST